MATPKRWAVREAANVTFWDLVTKKPKVTLNTLKMTEVETTGETVYSQGGRGNAKLVGFSSNREATMTLQDAIFDNAAMAMLTGNEISTAAKTVQIYNDIVLDEDGKGTLLNTPTSGAEAFAPVVYELDGNSLGKELTVTDDYTLSEKEIVAANHGNARLRVYYEYETPSDTQTIKVTADKFGGTYRVVADVLVRDEDTKMDFYGQFIAPNAKIEDSFTFNFSPDGDPSVLDIPLELLKDPHSDNMWELVIYGDEPSDDNGDGSGG